MKTLRMLMVLVLAACFAPSRPADAQSNAHRITGPERYGNLSIFLIHGADEAGHAELLTLQEAMAQGVLVVHETSNVNALEVENTSASRGVFIQSGDIVKGGKQDRVLSVDVVVPAK